MVLDNFSMTDSLSSASSISLYTGNYKLANISLNIGMAGLLRLLPGGLSSGGNNLFEIRVYFQIKFFIHLNLNKYCKGLC
jgi:hypothetical protein